MGNEGFYLRLVKMAAEDPGFGKLFQAVDEGDLDAAFEAAHALKGVLGNLSLTPVLEPVEVITEHLRAREEMDYSGLIGEIREKYEALKTICAE